MERKKNTEIKEPVEKLWTALTGQEKIARASTGLVPFSLEGYSARFGIKREYLQWGIVKITRGENVEEFCAVLIEGAPVYIHIIDDAITPGISRTGCRIEQIPCNFKENKKSFVFESKEKKIKITLMKDNVKEFFASRVLCPATQTYLGGSYWDY